MPGAVSDEDEKGGGHLASPYSHLFHETLANVLTSAEAAFYLGGSV